jgi:catechol 2,3-dioxygenase-like lactoylglutathione lyase family enzyme
MTFIATAKPEAAKAFYEEILGLTLQEDTPFALVFDANGTILRIQKVPELVPVGYTVLGWQVADLRATLAELRQRGISFARYPGLAQDEDGVWTAPNGDNIVWFTDPDGNTLSLAELHPA